MLGAAWILAGALAVQTPVPPPPAAPPPRIPASSSDDRPITHIFQNLVGDLRRLPAHETALIAAIGTGAALAAHPVDDNLDRWVAARDHAGYTTIGNVLGDGWLQGGTALGTWAVGRLRNDPFISHLGSDLIRSQVLNAVLTRSLKFATRRDRPSGGSDSLPSGHTSASFATAAVLQEHFGWPAGVAAYATAGFVGWSRIRDHHHWLTDVFVGAAVGTLAGRTVVRGHAREWIVVPEITTTRAEIRIVHVGR